MFAEALIVADEIYYLQESHNCPRTFDTYFMILAATSGLSVGSSIRKIGRWSFLGPTSLVTPSHNAILIPFGSVGGAKFRKVVPFREEVPFSESQEMCHQLLQPLNDVYH